MDKRQVIIEAMRAAAAAERVADDAIDDAAAVDAGLLAEELRAIAERKWPGRFSAVTSS